MLLGDLAQGGNFAEARVGENDIESPLLPDCFVETIQIGQFGNVSLDAGDVAAYCLHRFIEFFLATAGNKDVGAFLDEELGGGQTDSRSASGDDCHFVLQPTHDPYSS